MNDVWTATSLMAADSDELLDALTDPDLIAVWAPVGFELEHLDSERLEPGRHARVRGALAGVGAAFDVEVLQADEDGLDLLARGPVEIDVAYRFFDQGDSVAVQALVTLGCAGGFRDKLLRAATAALLNSGALERALRRLRDSVGAPAERELVAA